MTWLLDWLLPDRNPHAESLWCRWGLHRWSVGLRSCEECRFPDRVLAPDRYREWKKDQRD